MMACWRMLLPFFLMFSVNASADTWGLDTLMQTLARHKGGRATFSEKKFIAMLNTPVESSGELVYVAPGHLEKNTLKPKPEYLTLDQGVLSIIREGKKQTLLLSDYPDIAAFIDSIRGTLAGDRSALERVYRLFLGGSYSHWTLILLPSSPDMLASISRINIIGEAEWIRSVEILQADGDRSVMSIEPVKSSP